MPRYTVPNFVGTAILALSGEDFYHLREGFGWDYPDPIPVTFKGHYAKVRLDCEDQITTLVNYLGYYRWWEKYSPKKTFWGKLFGTWTEKVQGSKVAG